LTGEPGAPYSSKREAAGTFGFWRLLAFPDPCARAFDVLDPCRYPGTLREVAGRAMLAASTGGWQRGVEP